MPNPLAFMGDRNLIMPLFAPRLRGAILSTRLKCCAPRPWTCTSFWSNFRVPGDSLENRKSIESREFSALTGNATMAQLAASTCTSTLV